MRRFPTRFLLAISIGGSLLAGLLATSEGAQRMDPLALLQDTSEAPSTLFRPCCVLSRAAAAGEPCSEIATDEVSPVPLEDPIGAADFALLVLDKAGPCAEKRLELWYLSENGGEEHPILWGIEETDSGGWVRWEGLSYGRYLLCAPHPPGHRGYRGPGVTGRELARVEHRLDLLAARAVEIDG